jgi:hypothetical protein
MHFQKDGGVNRDGCQISPGDRQPDHTWLQKKDRTPEQMAKFLLEMLVQLRS